jgi:hypothetical protein
MLSGSTTPGLNVAAWRAGRFLAAGQNVQEFPGIGQTIPASPDAGPVVAAGNGSWTLNTSTAEDFYVAVYDGSNKIVNYFDQLYHPPRLAPASIMGGAGDPTQSTHPAFAWGAAGDLYIRTDSSGPGTTVYQRRSGAWVATAV